MNAATALAVIQLLGKLAKLVEAMVAAGKDPLIEIPVITGRYAQAGRAFDDATDQAIRDRFGGT